MASNIDPSNIDGTYPLEGVNNDSQGFRTNFTNTAANLTEAKTEIEELQSKAILKSALIGEAADNTLTIPLNTAASTTAAAGLNIAEGIAPTSPVDGDLWITAAGAFNARLNGVTVDLSPSTGKLEIQASTTTEAGINLAEGVAPTSPIDGDIWVTAAGGFFVQLDGVSVDLGAAGSSVFTRDATSGSIYSTGAGGSLAVDGVDNFFVGTGAGGAMTNGDNNIAIGNAAFATNVNASGNIALGHDAMTNGFGTDNVVIGNSAGDKMTNDGFNVIVGGSAGRSLTSGATYNVVLGHSAMGNNAVSSFGDNNVAIGRNALRSASLVDNSVAIGINALNLCASGDGNIAIGGGANGPLGKLTTGPYNIGIGYQAGANWTVGATKNIAIGYAAGPVSDVDEDNQLYIHNAAGTPLIGGDFGTGIVRLSGAIRLTERADHIEVPTAGFGELWLRSDTPNVLVFTDDAGTDHELGTGAAVTGVPADDQIAVWTGAGAIEGTGFAKITGLTGQFPTLELDGFTNVAHRYPTLLLNYDASDYGSIEFQEEGATRGHIRYYATGPGGGTDVLRVWNTVNGGATTNSTVEIGADNILLLRCNEEGTYFPRPIQMLEQVDHSFTPTAGSGEIWIRDDAPNTLMFTDDTGVDYAVAGAAANGLPAGGTTGQILVKQSATTGDATWEDFGSIPASATEYFPGYNYSQSTTSIFTVDLVDAANLFYVGRRVKFDKAGVFTYGDVTAVDFNSTNANDTTVTVSGTPVPADPFDVALVTSATAWSAIATDPFGGSQINDIAGGQIGATYYLIACGALGKIAYSTDGGLNWTAVTPAQSNELLQIAYDPDNQEFMISGKGATIMKSSTGTGWSEDSTALRALGGSDPRDPYLVYDQELNVWSISVNLSGTSYRNYYSNDFAVSWIAGDTSIAAGIATKMRYLQLFTGAEYLYQAIGSTVYNWDNGQDSAVGTSITDFTSGAMNDIFAFVDNANNDVVAIAHDNGDVTFYDATSPSFTFLSRDDISLGGNALYGVAYSPLHNRTVVVGANGTIGYCNDADTSTNDSVVGVANGFGPTSNIRTVFWDSNSGQFIAAADNGQICRSSNGTN